MFREACRARYYTTLAFHVSCMFIPHVLRTLVEDVDDKKKLVGGRISSIVDAVIAGSCDGNLYKNMRCALTPTTNSTNETRWRWLEQSTGQGRPSELACRGPVSLVRRESGIDRARRLIYLIDLLTGPSSTRTLLRTGKSLLSVSFIS